MVNAVSPFLRYYFTTAKSNKCPTKKAGGSLFFTKTIKYKIRKNTQEKDLL
jgi:hypothetical protein